eukprot:m51a1_g10656 hypothetical protein (347) ;mRNA; r:30269-38067
MVHGFYLPPQVMHFLNPLDDKTLTVFKHDLYLIVQKNLSLLVAKKMGLCDVALQAAGMMRDQDLGHDPVMHQAEAYAQVMMRAQAVQFIDDILQGIAIPFAVFNREALFEYMQVVGKKLATAAKMNVAIKAFSMQALFSEEIVVGKKLATAAKMNVAIKAFSMQALFVTYQKLIEVDISKANGKTIVPVIHKHIKKDVQSLTAHMKDLNVQYLAAQEELQRLTAKVASAAAAAGPVAGQQQDEVAKSLQAARANLKKKIAMYKKDLHKVTNNLHEQHVLVAMLKSQNEGLKEQLELLKSEHANWRNKKQDKFYNGKYKGHVVKIQVSTTRASPWTFKGCTRGFATT